MRNYNATLCVSAILLSVSAVSAAPTLTFRFKTITIPGGTQVIATGISESGEIVGSYLNSGVYDGYSLKGKTVSEINDPKGSGTMCTAISPNGVYIVGYYLTASSAMGFLYKGKKFTDIPGPAGSTESEAFGVNDSGEIVGASVGASGPSTGFLLKNGKYTLLSVSGAPTEATGINDGGTIVGFWFNSGGVQSSFMTTNLGKTYKTINVPGAAESQAWGINTDGDIVYTVTDSKGIEGAVRRSGKYYKFDDPKGIGETSANGINDHNQIVGYYIHRDFQAYEAAY